MDQNLQFLLDDTSPSISYFPFPDTYTVPNLSAGWNPYFTESGFAASLGQVGSGTSLHITALSGASLSVQWNGTGIQLFGNTTGQASYAITLDGTPTPPNSSSPDDSILAAFQNLTDTNHTISLTTQITDPASDGSFIAFDKALITAAPPPDASNSSFSTKTLPDGDVAFLGQWQFNGTGQQPMHISTTVGDRARASFRGTALTLTGMLSPVSGAFSVTLDNSTTQLSARSSFSMANATLFFAAGLDETTTHSVEIQNDDGSTLGLVVGAFNVTGDGNPQPSSSSSSSSATSSSGYSRGTIAALALAGVVILLLTGALLFYLFYFRPRARQCRELRREQRFPVRKADEGVQTRAIDVLDISPSRTSAYGVIDEEDADELDTTFTHEQGYKVPALSANDEKFSSVDFNLDPALYTQNLELQSRAGSKKSKGKGKKRRSNGSSYTFDLPIPAIFRSRSPSHQSRSTNSSSNSQRLARSSAQPPIPSSQAPAASQLLPPSPGWRFRSSRSSVATTGHPHPPPGHVREGSLQLLLGKGYPESPVDGADVQGIELALGPRISRVTSPVVLPPSRPHTSELTRPRTAESSRPRTAESSRPRTAESSRPRTSESLGPRVSFGPREQSNKAPQRTSIAPERLDQPLERSSTLLAHPSTVIEERRLSTVESNQSRDNDSGADASDHPFLDVRTTSPFRVDFIPGSKRASIETRKPRLSVQFNLGDGLEPPRISDEPRRNDVRESTGLPRLPELADETGLPARPHPIAMPRQDSGFSFLDFSSRASSLRESSNSTNASSNSQRSQRAQGSHEQLPSHWSTASGTALSTAAPTEALSLASPQTQQSSPAFPFPVSLPSSSHHQIGTHPFSRTALHLQPPPPYHHHGASDSGISPTDSIPMTVSDIHFLQADSDSGGIASRRTSTGSHLPPHPPLPVSQDDQGPAVSTPLTAALGAPPFIVQRVLGMTTPASSVGSWSVPVSPRVPQMHHGRSGSIQNVLGSLDARETLRSNRGDAPTPGNDRQR